MHYVINDSNCNCYSCLYCGAICQNGNRLLQYLLTARIHCITVLYPLHQCLISRAHFSCYCQLLTFAPIWFPHWPAWMCTISLMAKQLCDHVCYNRVQWSEWYGRTLITQPHTTRSTYPSNHAHCLGTAQTIQEEPLINLVFVAVCSMTDTAPRGSRLWQLAKAATASSSWIFNEAY